MEDVNTIHTVGQPRPDLNENDLHSIYRTSKKVIQEYVREIERHNRYKTARADMAIGAIMDNRGALIDLYESCMQQDAHIKSVIERIIIFFILL